MNSGFTLMPIVEGDGEVQAAPVLLRRIAGEIYGRYDVAVREPWRMPRSKLVMREEVQPVLRFLSRAASPGAGGAILVLDLDDDPCAVELAERIHEFNNTCLPLQVVVAKREFEAWFLASVQSLCSHKSVADDARFEGDPEAPRDAKGRLEKCMNESYKETLHQSSFCQTMDFVSAADGSRSFRRMVSAVGHLLG